MHVIKHTYSMRMAELITQACQACHVTLCCWICARQISLTDSSTSTNSSKRLTASCVMGNCWIWKKHVCTTSTFTGSVGNQSFGNEGVSCIGGPEADASTYFCTGSVDKSNHFSCRHILSNVGPEVNTFQAFSLQEVKMTPANLIMVQRPNCWI